MRATPQDKEEEEETTIKLIFLMKTVNNDMELWSPTVISLNLQIIIPAVSFASIN